MSLDFYNGSGSPFAWRVWLALEHKQVPYQIKTLSFDRREHRTPEFLAINPRGKVPAIVDGSALFAAPSSHPRACASARANPRLTVRLASAVRSNTHRPGVPSPDARIHGLAAVLAL